MNAFRLTVWKRRLGRLRFEGRYLTPLKLANIALVNLQWRLRTEFVLGRPYEFVIEPTNICNTNCQLCPTGLGQSMREKGVLPWERYKELIDRYSSWIFRLNLSLWGEPLLARDLFRMIEYAHGKRIWTCLSTNLHAFRPESGDAAALVKSGLDSLTCSLHAASPETYRIYQPGKDFHRTVAKIRALAETKRRIGNRTPAIYLSFVVTRFNEHEIPVFESLARELEAIPRFLEPSLNLRFLPPQDREREIETRLRTWLPEDPNYVNESYRQMLAGASLEELSDGRKFHSCRRLWTSVDITWDGAVLPCSAPRTLEEAFGHLSQETLERIWNGAKYRAARRSMSRPVEDEVVCAHCSGLAV